MSAETQPLVAAEATNWTGLSRAASMLDRAIGAVCEATGAARVLAEVFILFAGVVSRYVLDRPLFWTDELANTLFLWLAMLGVVVALRANAHMRLTTSSTGCRHSGAGGAPPSLQWW